MPKTMAGMKKKVVEKLACNVQRKFLPRRRPDGQPAPDWTNMTHYIDPSISHMDQKWRFSVPQTTILD